MMCIKAFKNISVIILVILCASITGCASKLSRMDTIQESSGAKDFDSVLIEIQGRDSTIEAVDGYQNTVDVLAVEIAKNIINVGGLNVIEDISQHTDAVEVSVTITELSYVSGAARALSGVLAGEAILGGRIDVKKPGSDELLGSVEFLEKSGLSGGIFSDYTGKQLITVSKYVLNMLE